MSEKKKVKFKRSCALDRGFYNANTTAELPCNQANSLIQQGIAENADSNKKKSGAGKGTSTKNTAKGKSKA